jgi:nicotinamide-nucleotide amidase
MAHDAASDSVADHLQAVLLDREETLAVAESSTGGLVGSMITDVPGASGYFDRSIVTYSNDAKLDLLGVDQETLDRVGAVSAAIARQMARGVRENAGTEWGLSTTGIAGPSGGTEEKPVGTVFVGVAHASEEPTATRYTFEGARQECKAKFADQAIAELIAAVESAD